MHLVLSLQNLILIESINKTCYFVKCRLSAQLEGTSCSIVRCLLPSFVGRRVCLNLMRGVSVCFFFWQGVLERHPWHCASSIMSFLTNKRPQFRHHISRRESLSITKWLPSPCGWVPARAIIIHCCRNLETFEKNWTHYIWKCSKDSEHFSNFKIMSFVHLNLSLFWNWKAFERLATSKLGNGNALRSLLTKLGTRKLSSFRR